MNFHETPKGTAAIFGGTFSPVHNGHITAMKAFANAVRPDKLYVIPTSTPPHKKRSDMATDAQRLEMLRLAVKDLDVPCEICVSDMEILRGGRSFTIDTVNALYRLFEKLYLYCGTDMMLSFDTWHLFWRIFSVSTVAYMEREGDFRHNEEVEKKVAELREKYNAKIIKIQGTPFEVSSSEIRGRIRKGLPITGLVPPEVEEYIAREGLYL